MAPTLGSDTAGVCLRRKIPPDVGCRSRWRNGTNAAVLGRGVHRYRSVYVAAGNGWERCIWGGCRSWASNDEPGN